MTTAQAVVDSHIHLWDADRFDYPWLQGFTEVNRLFVPADLDVGDVLIEGLIFVQANPCGRPWMRTRETMIAFQRSSDSGAHVTLETTCERPEPLPTATEEVLF